MIIRMSPHRRVNDDNVLVSHGMPPIRLQVVPRLTLRTHLKFTMADVAYVEAFVFGETDLHGTRIDRLLVVQFEGYLPDNTYSYDYPDMDVVKLGQHDYLSDGGVLKLDALLRRRPEGDIKHWVMALKAQGYDPLRWNDLAYQRYVRILDRARRSELLLLYFENLDLHGQRADSLLYDPARAEDLRAVKAAVRASARLAFSVVQG